MPNADINQAGNMSLNRLLNIRKSNAEASLTVPLGGGYQSVKETNYVKKHNGDRDLSLPKDKFDGHFRMKVSERR